MKRIPKIWTAAIILIALVSAAVFFVNYHLAHKQLTSQEVVQRLGEMREQSGEMTKADQIKLAAIQAGIAKGGTISDQDLKWDIDLLQKKSPKNTEVNRNIKAGSVMLNLTGLKTLSLIQQQELYQALHPYLTQQTTEESHSLKLMAIRILGNAKVTAAEPDLERLSKDIDEEVSQRAAKALHKMTASESL